MAKKAAIAVGLGLAGVAGAMALIARAKAAPEELPPHAFIPTVDDVMASRTMGELEVYYMYIGQLLVTNQIDRATYEGLYHAYVARFYQLTGWQQ